MKLRVSEDLPSYLASKYTEKVPMRRSSRPYKSYKSGLISGISAEAPPNFHLRNVNSMNSVQKDKERLGEFYNSSLVNSNMKRNIVCTKPAFSYQDYRDSKEDYISLSPSRRIDLVADKAPNLKASLSYMIEYTNRLKNGFGQARGEFAVHSIQPNVPRHNISKLLFLRKSVKEKYLKPIEKAKPACPKHKTSSVKINTPKTRSSDMERIDEFQKYIDSIVITQKDRRKLYD